MSSNDRFFPTEVARYASRLRGVGQFAGKHETLGGKSPAMATGLAEHVWSVKELLERAADA
jgi:hypothetical protein